MIKIPTTETTAISTVEKLVVSDSITLRLANIVGSNAVAMRIVTSKPIIQSDCFLAAMY